MLSVGEGTVTTHAYVFAMTRRHERESGATNHQANALPLGYRDRLATDRQVDVTETFCKLLSF